MQLGHKKTFKWGLTAVVTAILFGCGGSGTTTDESSSSAASVAVRETASGLSVRTTVSDGSSVGNSLVQASLYTFTGDVTAGSHTGQSLNGMLILKTVLQDDGTSTVEGTLISGKLTADAASSDAVVALQAEFTAAMETLKAAYKTDVEALRDTLMAALDAVGPSTGHRLNEAQLAALKTFFDAVKARTELFQADAAALVTTYRDKITAAGGDATTIHLGGQRGSGKTAYAVTGTLAADGSLSLTFTSDDQAVITGVGTTAEDGTLSGTFSGPASDDAGTWQAAARAKPGRPTPPWGPASAASGSFPSWPSPPASAASGSLPSWPSPPASAASGSLPSWPSPPASAASSSQPNWPSPPASSASDAGSGGYGNGR